MMESKFLFIHDNDPGARQKVRKHVSKIMRGRKHQLRSENPFPKPRYSMARRLLEYDIELDFEIAWLVIDPRKSFVKKQTLM